MRFTLWFEPERVVKGTQVTREHPEWLLGPVGENYLYNLGDRSSFNPQALAMEKTITRE